MKTTRIVLLAIALVLVSCVATAFAEDYSLTFGSEGSTYTKTDDGQFCLRCFVTVENNGTKPASLYGITGDLRLSDWEKNTGSIWLDEVIYAIDGYCTEARMYPAVLQPGKSGYVEWTIRFPDNGLYSKLKPWQGFSLDPISLTMSPVAEGPHTGEGQMDVIQARLQQENITANGVTVPSWTVEVAAKNNTGATLYDPTIAMAFGRDENFFIPLDASVVKDFPGMSVAPGETLALTMKLDQNDLSDLADYYATWDSDPNSPFFVERMMLVEMVVVGQETPGEKTAASEGTESATVAPTEIPSTPQPTAAPKAESATPAPTEIPSTPQPTVAPKADGPAAKLANWKEGETVVIPGYGEVTLTKAEWCEKLNKWSSETYYSDGAFSFVRTAFYDSGDNSVYLHLHIAILNTQLDNYNFYNDFKEISCLYDHQYQFNGWVSIQAVIRRKDGKDRLYCLSNVEEGWATSPFYKDEFDVVVTLPNEVKNRVVNEKKPLVLTFKIGDYDVAYKINAN